MDKVILDKLEQTQWEILQSVFEAKSSSDLLPKDLALKLVCFKVIRHQVSRIILRINKRRENEFGEHIVEKRGWHWGLTSFAFEAWGRHRRKNCARVTEWVLLKDLYT